MDWLQLIMAVTGLNLAGIVVIVWQSAKRQQRFETLEERHKTCPVFDLKDRVQKVESSIELFRKILEPHLAAIIHSPEHVDRDILVDKLLNKSLITEEANNLLILLSEEALKSKDGNKRLASAMLQFRVTQYIQRLNGDL